MCYNHRNQRQNKNLHLLVLSELEDIMGLGFFMIFLIICGAGVFAFLFFSFAGFVWKKEKKAAAALLAILGMACAGLAFWLAFILIDGLRYFF